MSSLAAEPPSSHTPEAHARPPFSDVSDGLGRIDQSGAEQLSAAALRDDLRWFAAQQRALEARAPAGWPSSTGAGNVLHVGRRSRAVPASVRRALNLRDQRCQEPGCTMPPELCSLHHHVHWVDGGPETLPNLSLYCDVHHARRHPENARFRTPTPGSPFG